MRQYSDSTVSRLLNSVTADQSAGFLNEWNEGRSRREKIYISYDATNKNSQAGDIDMVELGHAKTDMGVPIFSYTIAYDRNNEEPRSIQEVLRTRYSSNICWRKWKDTVTGKSVLLAGSMFVASFNVTEWDPTLSAFDDAKNSTVVLHDVISPFVE